ncbi:MAG: DNA polymerase I [Lachnospiraceae bacterium]|nr:DNA polymerase I [Lachnospiraceae bacterium]
MAEKLVLIDGHSILNRAFFGVPDLTNAEGFHTNAIYGFLNIMFRILEEEKPQYLAVAFDVHAPTFRHEMYPEYKGTRKPMAEELREQVPVMKEMLKAMNIAVVEQAGLEADDILGTLAKKAEAEGMDVALVSGDRDLLQIASDHIMIRIPKTKRGGTEIENYYAADVEKTYQLSPARFIELKALMGDSSDNVPGVPKVGEKTATELMVTYGSIEGIYEHLEEIKKNAIRESLRENKEILDLCLKLVTIKTDCELPIGPKDAALPDMYTPEAYELCRKLEFKAMLSRFGQETKKEQKTYSRQWVKEESAAKTILQGAAGKEKAALLVYPLEQGDFILSVAEAEKVSLLRAGDFKEGCLAGLVKELYQKTSIVTFDSKRLYAVLFGNVAGSVSTPKEETQMTFEDLLLQSDNTAETPKDTAKTELRIAEEAVAKIEDLLLAGYLLNPLKSDTQIEDLAKQYLDELITPYEEKFGKKSYAAAVTEDKETFAGLAAQETAQLLPLYDALMQALTKQEMAKLYREVELPLSYVLYCMEREGIQADAQALKVYGDELASQITVLEKKIYEAAGEEFNINSPKQLAEILFEKMHLPGGKKTKTGYSTSAEVLEKLAPDVPFVRDVLEYRTYAKLKSTYADGLATFIASDGRIHTKFNQTITATGRLSSTDPNLQNIPMRTELGRKIRKVFTPKEGCIFADADYSQIELRILASMAGDKELIEAYKGGKDIHRITASKVFGVPFDEVTDLQRRNAKAVNFGIVYGISAFGLSQDLTISKGEAKEYIEQYFATYPGIKIFLEKCKREAKEKGYSVTAFGRRRPIPELASSNFMQRQFGERVAMNAPIQGTAADIMKIAMVRVFDRLVKERLKSRLLLQIHDELLIETAKDEEAQVLAILKEEMMGAADFPVALEVDAHTGSDWYEAK